MAYFYDTVSISDYIALNGRIIGEEQIIKHSERSSHGIIRVATQHLPGVTQENQQKTQNSQCPSQSLN
jgi:hypothetical protein